MDIEKTMALSGVTKKDDRLLPCPFCGSKPVMQFQGNAYTRSRELTIKCTNPKCRIQRTDGAIKHGHEFLDKIGVEAWNRRATP